jgi:hypothetical protein
VADYDFAVTTALIQFSCAEVTRISIPPRCLQQLCIETPSAFGRRTRL